MTSVIWNADMFRKSLDTSSINEAHMKLLTSLAIGITLFSITASATDLIAERKANFKANAAAMRAMGGQLGSNDFAGVAAGADKIASYAVKMTSYFPEGSRSEGARDDIWQAFETFTALAQKNQQAALAVKMSAEAGDKAAIQQAIQTLGASCKACHSKFKN